MKTEFPIARAAFKYYLDYLLIRAESKSKV